MRKILLVLFILCLTFSAEAAVNNSPFKLETEYNPEEMQIAAECINNFYRGITPKEKFVSDGFGGVLLFCQRDSAKEASVYIFPNTDIDTLKGVYNDQVSANLKRFIYSRILYMGIFIILANVYFNCIKIDGRKLHLSLSRLFYLAISIFVCVFIIASFEKYLKANTKIPLEALTTYQTENGIYSRNEIPELMKYYDAKYQDYCSKQD